MLKSANSHSESVFHMAICRGESPSLVQRGWSVVARAVPCAAAHLQAGEESSVSQPDNVLPVLCSAPLDWSVWRLCSWLHSTLSGIGCNGKLGLHAVARLSSKTLDFPAGGSASVTGTASH